LKSKSDPEIIHFIKDKQKEKSAYYESELDLWVWQNPQGVFEVISGSEIDAAHRALNSFYGWFWDGYEDEDEEKEKKPEKAPEGPKTPCYSATIHRFKKEILLQVFHQVCERCGYSPTLSVLPGFEKCHDEFLEHVKKFPPEKD